MYIQTPRVFNTLQLKASGLVEKYAVYQFITNNLSYVNNVRIDAYNQLNITQTKRNYIL